MAKSDIFLDFYNKIDAFLKKDGKFDTQTSFSQKVKNSKNKVVKNYKNDLITLGELRNAIVHNSKIEEKAIAEPHETTVELIEKIHNEITNPKKVFPLFQINVCGAQRDDYINEILKEMRENSFSQFPVFDNNEHVIELISTNTIARWLSSQLEDKGSLLLDEVRVKHFIDEIEFKNNYKFISKRSSIYDAYHLFFEQIEENKRNLDVIFITDSGKQSERLLGLITIEDISKEFSKNNFSRYS